MRYPNIKAEISRQGMTQAEVADIIGMSQQNLSFKLTGRVVLTVPEAKKIQAAVCKNATLDYLLVTDEEMESTGALR